jgi:menaquinone-dependent protoporphyrinogen oxidase
MRLDKVKKVLIVYGTRYGSTEEISRDIAKFLLEVGIETELVNLRTTKSKKWPQIDEFDGIIVGTSLKMNKWKKEAKSFIDKNKDYFKDGSKPLGVFTCGAYAVGEPDKAHDDIAERLMKNYGLKANLHGAFGGVFDFTEDSNLGKIGQAALKAAAQGIKNDKGVQFNFNGYNDFRDRDKIRTFAENFSTLI